MNVKKRQELEKMLFDKRQINTLLRKRELINKVTENKFGKEVVVAGWVKRVREVSRHLKFLILSDYSGEIQLTFKSNICKNIEDVDKLSLHTFVIVKGEACKGLSKRGREIVVKDFYLLSEIAEPLPIEIENIPTSLEKRLDYRWLDLRHSKHRFPLIILSEFAKYAREFFYKNDFVEIFTPKLMGSPSESGAEVFTLPYFDKVAYLAQSPQFYKQMAICSGLEKVFEIAPVFRANPSFTTRHDTEFTSLDVEIAYISSHHNLMDFVEEMLAHISKRLKGEWEAEMKKHFNVTVYIPRRIPRIKMVEVYEIVSKQNISQKGDLRPAGERELSKYVMESYGNEFVFVTDYPYSARPFYHMKGAPIDGKETTKSFDLIYRGLEITTGAQREHRYTKLVRQVKEKDLNPENLKYFLDFFKYGAPPHGGFGFGPTRFVMGLLKLKNVREATFIPRDPKRLFP